MGFFEKMTQAETGQILISIIWGLGLAAFFKRACNGRQCIILQGPPPDEITGNIYKFEEKCYKFQTEPTRCKNVIVAKKGLEEKKVENKK